MVTSNGLGQEGRMKCSLRARKQLFEEWHQRNEKARDGDFDQSNDCGVSVDGGNGPLRRRASAAGAGYEQAGGTERGRGQGQAGVAGRSAERKEIDFEGWGFSTGAGVHAEWGAGTVLQPGAGGLGRDTGVDDRLGGDAKGGSGDVGAGQSGTGKAEKAGRGDADGHGAG